MRCTSAMVGAHLLVSPAHVVVRLTQPACNVVLRGRWRESQPFCNLLVRAGMKHLQYEHRPASYQEIAERLGISAKTVENPVARGLRETPHYVRRRYKEVSSDHG